MIRLRLLQTLLLLQIATVEGLFNKTNCDTTKACWVSEECARNQDRNKLSLQNFYLRKEKPDLENLKNDCVKYLIVEPGLENFVFELMYGFPEENKKVTINFNKKDPRDFKAYISCQDNKTETGQQDVNIESEEIPDRDDMFYCRFKVTRKSVKPGDVSFFEFINKRYKTYDAYLEIKDSQNPNVRTISVDNYNREIFIGRVPCATSTIFTKEGHDGKEYNIQPFYNVEDRKYTCPENYTMRYKIINEDDVKIKMRHEELLCNLGTILYDDVVEKEISSAKCSRPGNTFCENMCQTSFPEAKCSNDKEVQKIGCNTTFMVLNSRHITKRPATCSDRSEPDKHLWKLGDGKLAPLAISSVKCVNELDCTDIAPYLEDNCTHCSKAQFEGGSLKCSNGSNLVYIDKNDIRHPGAVITCNTNTGKWDLQYENKTELKTREDGMKLTCEGKPPKKEENPSAPAAASSGALIYIGVGLGAIILLLLIILLLYYICCRKGREPPKEEPTKEPPPSAPTKTESSVVEEPIPAPPPIAPSSTESEAPLVYSGKRVQFINMSKEALREIEPDFPPEFSARDKTDSDRSKASQMSQVGGTSDAGITFTGPGTGTDKTNDVSRTIAAADNSDVSNGRNTPGDRSQTGADGKTPTIDDAKKRQEKKRKEGGPRVEFRERVSYETETKTRDKSTAASMHTAPEQPLPKVDNTQPEGTTQEGGKKKDEPSLLSADAARKAFGKEQTRTTQNTRETTNDDANKSQQSQDSTVGKRSRVTDLSRTG